MKTKGRYNGIYLTFMYSKWKLQGKVWSEIDQKSMFLGGWMDGNKSPFKDFLQQHVVNTIP